MFITILFVSLKINFVITNNADPSEMSPHAAFRLGLQCFLYNIIARNGSTVA